MTVHPDPMSADDRAVEHVRASISRSLHAAALADALDKVLHPSPSPAINEMQEINARDTLANFRAAQAVDDAEKLRALAHYGAMLSERIVDWDALDTKDIGA